MKRVKSIAIASVMLMIFMFSVSFAAKTIDILGGQVSITDNANTGSGTEEKYTATAKGSIISKKTNTITITNETDDNAVISFGYTADKASAFTIDGTSVSASADYSAQLAGGGTITIVLTSNSGLSNTTATLTLTNITYAPVADSSEIDIEFDSSLGTVTVDATAISSGSTVTVGQSGIQLVATPKTGARFVAWADENGKIIEKVSEYTQMPLAGLSKLRALFTSNTPYFIDDKNYIFDDLNKAIQNKGEKIILACDGVLKSGDYTIPSGVTLLIPFNDVNTIYDKNPEGDENYTKPSVYRTLTMASGANIIVNGTINISANQCSAMGWTGLPTGKYGLIKMEADSTITVNDGGKLYAWGYITGSGEITAESGATVYEDFQVEDWRGGTVTSSMLNNKYGVFPMSQYYVQNIEVPLTLKEGAAENGYMSIAVTLLGIQGSEVPFIGPDGMFNIKSGSITKDYDETSDRLLVNVNGDLEMKNLSVSMNTVGTINSEKYTLPINGNITLNINGGSKVNVTQDIALLPGAVINVNRGAECTFAENSKAIIYDADDWGKYSYDKDTDGSSNEKFVSLKFAPGRKYNRTEADLVDAVVYIAGTVDASNGFVYTTGSSENGGANICGAEGGIVRLKKVDNTNTTVTYYASQDNKSITYNSIPVTTAKIKNTDDTYTWPGDPADPYPCLTYVYSNGNWIPHHTIQQHAAQPATCTEIGWNAYETCSICSYTTYEEIPALGHDKVQHEAQAATCEEIGWDVYETCSSCSYTTYSEIAALGHDKQQHAAQPATCTEIGWNAYETCSRCSYTTYSEIAALGHEFDGLNCSVCGAVKMVTSTEHTISGESIIINTSLVLDVPADTQIIIATYDEYGRLLNISLSNASSLCEIALPSADVKTIRVFACAGFNKLTPVSGVEEITLL